MNLRQMFPRMTLDPEDVIALCGHNGCTIQIDGIDFRTKLAPKPGEAGIDYFIIAREFKRPIKINRKSARVIAQVLGSEETDDWIGRLIHIRPVQIEVGINLVWVFDVDSVAPNQPSGLRPKQDIAGLMAEKRAAERGLAPPRQPFRPAAAHGAEATSPMSPAAAKLEAPRIGIDHAVGIYSALHERGKTQQDLYLFVKDLGMESSVSGKELHEWPTTVLPAARTFCRSLPKSQAPMTEAAIAELKARWQPPPPPPSPPSPPPPQAAKPTEVVDKRTGEVIPVAHPDAKDGDEIPF